MSKLAARMKVFFRRGEEGATMVEYGLMLARIAAVCITAVAAVGTGANNTFNSIVGAL